MSPSFKVVFSSLSLSFFHTAHIHVCPPTMDVKREFVLDFQAYTCSHVNPLLDDRLIIKEISVYGLGDVNLSINLIVKPPIYTPKHVRIGCFNSEECGIGWQHGYVTLRDAIRIIRDICSTATCIYTRGSERVQFANHAIFAGEKPVADLEKCGCPKYSDLVGGPNPLSRLVKPSCYYTFHLDEYELSTARTHACSHKNAWAYKTWFDCVNAFNGGVIHGEPMYAEEKDGSSETVENINDYAARQETMYWALASKFHTEVNEKESILVDGGSIVLQSNNSTDALENTSMDVNYDDDDLDFIQFLNDELDDDDDGEHCVDVEGEGCSDLDNEDCCL